MKILAMSGSLRAGSINTALLHAARCLAPPEIKIALFSGFGLLPHFDPDLDTQDGSGLPVSVIDLRKRIGEADGLLIACPEYAGGMPGSFKNMLDWLVGSTEFVEKPVAIFNASPRATEAQKSLRLVLRTMSARIIEESSIVLPFLGKEVDAASFIEDAAAARLISDAISAFDKAVTS
jgi:chromate reductase, NAD(P)H dehydrogenase (quinone)